MLKKAKGLYLLSEIQCLSPGSGAYHHVINGLEQLQKYFDIRLFIINKRQTPFVVSPLGKAQAKRQTVQPRKLKTIVKWFYILISQNYDIISWYFKVKKDRPEFIYERAASLNFKGLVIARLLKIPHFYEVNWAFYLEQSKQYPALLNKLSEKIETWAYNKSTFSFFVGGISKCFRLKKENCTSVQNGIDSSFADFFKDASSSFSNNERINIVFIGHAMMHHRLEMLAESFKLVNRPESFHMHFVGSNYEKFDLYFPNSLATTFHGSLDHKSIAQLLLNCDIGILPYAVPFSSAVKLFMYGAAGLVLLVPDVENLKEIFSDNEVVFFKNEDSASIATRLDNIAKNPLQYEQYRIRIRKTVSNKFLWDSIFKSQAEIINNIITKSDK